MDGCYSPSAVQVEAVCKTYNKVRAVRDLSFHVPEGRIVALIGHNGAGKTTLLKMVLGIAKPSSGQIRLWGETVRHGENNHSRQIGFLPEVANFNDAMTGEETLDFLARIKRQPGHQSLQLLERVGLAEAATRKIKTYSKGMRQRLGLAQALLGDPRLLILDEPTTGLDPDSRRDFYRILHERQRAGATIIISTHSLHEIEIQASRIAIMKRGRLAAFGSVVDLCNQSGIGIRIQCDVEPEAASGLEKKFAQHYSVTAATTVAAGTLEFTCNDRDKLSLMRDLLSPGNNILDIRIQTPRLDDVYRHYMGEGEA